MSTLGNIHNTTGDLMKCTCGLTYTYEHPWTSCLYGQLAKRRHCDKKVDLSPPKKLNKKDMSFLLRFIGEDPDNYEDELKEFK